MIGTNALAAFAQAISRNPAQPVRGLSGAPEGQAAHQGSSASPGQRTLDAVPPAPNRPLPRGSLLDLRV